MHEKLSHELVSYYGPIWHELFLIRGKQFGDHFFQYVLTMPYKLFLIKIFESFFITAKLHKHVAESSITCYRVTGVVVLILRKVHDC